MLRTENIQVKVTKQEKKEIQRLAKKERLNMSNFIRRTCLKKGE